MRIIQCYSFELFKLFFADYYTRKPRNIQNSSRIVSDLYGINLGFFSSRRGVIQQEKMNFSGTDEIIRNKSIDDRRNLNNKKKYLLLIFRIVYNIHSISDHFKHSLTKKNNLIFLPIQS
jgi:hypothetical protein